MHHPPALRFARRNRHGGPLSLLPVAVLALCLGMSLVLPAAGGTHRPAAGSISFDPSADLALLDSDAPDPVPVGGELVYTLSVSNQGPDQAEAIALSDTLPSSVSFGSASADQGSCSEQSNIVSCDLGNLAPLAAATVTIRVTPGQPGTIADAASITSTTPDPDSSNNTASTQTSIETPTPSRPNIVFVITHDQPAVDGRLINFQPTVKSVFKDHGVTFTDFHGESPLCCPGRAGFLSGQHTTNHGVAVNSASLFKPAMSLATQLHGVGYYTFLAGKYMNGYDGKRCTAI